MSWAVSDGGVGQLQDPRQALMLAVSIGAQYSEGRSCSDFSPDILASISAFLMQLSNLQMLN